MSVETLTHAVEVAGSQARLARELGVTVRQIKVWATGGEPVPMTVFMDALDVIADGGHTKEEADLPRGIVGMAPLLGSDGAS